MSKAKFDYLIDMIPDSFKDMPLYERVLIASNKEFNLLALAVNHKTKDPFIYRGYKIVLAKNESQS